MMIGLAKRQPNCLSSTTILRLNLKFVILLLLNIINFQHHSNHHQRHPFNSVEAQHFQPNKLCRPTIPLYHQHDNKLFFKIPENSPNGTCIGHIRSADNSIPDLLIALKKNSSDPHEINSVSDAELSYAFRLTSEGDLLTNAVLDRERREYYKFAAVCMKIFCEVVITIQIEDINDNAPKFYVPPEMQQLPTSKPEGLSTENISSIVIKWPEGQSRISYELPVAIDYDTGPNGIQEFVLRDANNTNRVQNIFCLVEHGAPSTTHCSDFSQDNTRAENALVDDIRQPFLQQDPVLVTSKQTAPAGSAAQPLFSYTKNSISLVNLKPLDRETQPRYQFIAQVVDGGQPPLIGRLLVTIEVTDINDNDPVFEKSYYEIRVKENITVGSSLLQVSAHDADLDANGDISYHLHDNSGLFRIDPKKGILFLAKQLDYELEASHELRVEARDHGQEPRSSYTVVKILIEDVDDRPAQSTLNRSSQQQQLVSAAAAAAAAADATVANGIQERGKQSSSSSSSSSATSMQVTLTSNELMLGFVNSPHMLFMMILVALTAITLLTCLAKIRSRQPESDYEDTAQTKECPGANDPPSDHHASAVANGGHHGSLNQYQVATLPLHNQVDHWSRRHVPSSTISHFQHHIQPPDSPPPGNQHQVATLPLPRSSSTHHQSSHHLNQVTVGSPHHTPFQLPSPMESPFSHWTQAAGSADSGGGGVGNLAGSAGSVGLPSQLVLTQDLYGSYNWDYLADWMPNYRTLMPIVSTY